MHVAAGGLFDRSPVFTLTLQPFSLQVNVNVITEVPAKMARFIVYIDTSRTEITAADFKFVVIPIPTNMRYKIKISSSAQVRLVLLVKRDERPTLWDFYGGDRISSSATLLDIDFSATRVRKVEHINTATGVDNVREENGTMTVTISGILHSEQDTTNLYIGIMPPFHDDLLCERCRAGSEGPCGFCFATTQTSPATEVNITIGRYMPDCLFWNDTREDWSNIGCEVSI